MDELQTIITTLSLAMGASWASGINLYATILTLGWLGLSGSLDLPPQLEILEHPAVLTVAGVLFLVEFFADKIPGVDSFWDSLQTFVRIPAGAILAASALGDVTPALSLTAALLGGSVAAATHATKSGSRLAINTSPEPVTNWTASIFEDLAVIGGLWTAVHYPWLFLVFFVAFIAFLVWFLPKLWRSIIAMGKRIFSFFKSPKKDKTNQVSESAATEAKNTSTEESTSANDNVSS